MRLKYLCVFMCLLHFSPVLASFLSPPSTKTMRYSPGKEEGFFCGMDTEFDSSIRDPDWTFTKSPSLVSNPVKRHSFRITIRKSMIGSPVFCSPHKEGHKGRPYCYKCQDPIDKENQSPHLDHLGKGWSAHCRHLGELDEHGRLTQGVDMYNHPMYLAPTHAKCNLGRTQKTPAKVCKYEIVRVMLKSKDINVEFSLVKEKVDEYYIKYNLSDTAHPSKIDTLEIYHTIIDSIPSASLSPFAVKHLSF